VILLSGCSSRSLGALALALSAWPASARAQPYEARWYSVDGGGTSRGAGGNFAVGGTVGQPDAGAAVVSPFAVGSGFWGATLSASGAELRVAVRDRPDPVALGGRLAYTITVRNAGPADAAGVVVDAAIPPGLVFVSNAVDCTTAFPCVVAGIPAGGTSTILTLLEVPPGYAGAVPIVDTVTVAAATPDPNAATNAAAVATAVGAASADLEVAKRGPAETYRGADVVYSITVTNHGPSPATAVRVTDAPATGLEFVANAGDCPTAFPCELGTLPAGASRVIASTFRVPLTYAGPEPVLNTATAASPVADPAPADNSAAAAAALVTPPGLSFYAVAPCRVLDTRNPPGPLGGPALGAQTTRRFTMTNKCGIPPSARALSVSMAVTSATVAGNLRLFPAQQSVPFVATIAYSAGQIRTNNAIVTLGPDADIDVFCGQASGTVHLILDVNGYFQ
jgi:uncharacterized repeat protein (TIGR01451 family)